MTDDPVDVRPTETVGEPDPLRWKALALLGTAFFMVILDATIVITAIPSMQHELGLSISGVQWVPIGYALTFGGLMLLGGRMADLLGRRRVFMVGLLLFVVSSLLCGLAWNGAMLIGSRMVQGVSAALLAPTALSIVMNTFGEDTERNRALGIWGGLGGVGATAGLLVGGVITSVFGWAWIFFINVPIGLVLLALSPVLLRESRSPGLTRSFDIPGAVTVTAALVLLIYAIFKAPDMGWGSLGTIGLFAAAAGLLTVFVLIEARSPAPLLPLRILRMRTLVGGNLAILAVGMAVDGMLFPLTLYSQEVLGYSALEFGLMSAVMTVMSVVGAVVGQGMVTRFGLRPVAVPSLLLITLGCLSLIWVSADGSYLNDVLLAMLLFGPGMGGAFVASQIAALTDIEEHESGLASGLVDTSFNIGSALGIALVTTAAVSRTKDLVAAGGDQAQPRVALTEGYQSAFLISVVFGLFGLVVAVFLLRGRAAGEDAGETEETEGIAPQAEAASAPRTD